MRVKEIMTRRVQTVAHTENAEAAWNLMRWKRIHHLVVLGERGEVAGVVSARDLGGRDRDEIRRMRPISAMMTAYAVKATPDMPVRQAANVMRGWNIGCLPVIEPDGTLAGIVTVSDLLRLLAEQVASPAPTRKTRKAVSIRRAAGAKPAAKSKAAKTTKAAKATKATKRSRPARA